MSTNRGGHRCHVVPIVWPRRVVILLAVPLLTDVSVVPSFPVTGRPRDAQPLRSVQTAPPGPLPGAGPLG